MEQMHGRLAACEVRAFGCGAWVSTLMLDWKQTNSLQFWELWPNWADYWGDSKMNTMQAPRLQSLSVRTHKDGCNWLVLWSEGQDTFRQLRSTAGIETCQMQRLQIAAGACQPHRHPQSTRQIFVRPGLATSAMVKTGVDCPSWGRSSIIRDLHTRWWMSIPHCLDYGTHVNLGLSPRHDWIKGKRQDKILYAIIIALQSFERK
jgi:hypothetical protein